MKAALLLLHGALGSRAQFDALSQDLSAHFSVHRLDFEGHGREPARPRPFRIEHFAENVLEALDALELESSNIFGFSMGGYVGLYLARHHGSRVRAIATLGTKLDWTPSVATRELAQLDPETLSRKVPAFVEELERRHQALGFSGMLEKTRELLADLGERPRLSSDELRVVDAPVRLMVGDRDRSVSMEETLAAYRALPKAEFCVLPGTPHPLERVPAALLTQMLCDFFGAPRHAAGPARSGGDTPS